MIRFQIKLTSFSSPEKWFVHNFKFAVLSKMEVCSIIRKGFQTHRNSTKTSRHIYRLRSGYYSRKKHEPVTWFSDTHTFRKFSCHMVENFVCGAIRLFSRTNLWYQPSPPSTESCFLPVAHSFISLVAQNRSIGINTARLDDEEKVYVVNFES